MREISAKLNLLFYFLLHFLKKPFVKRRGLKEFYELYCEDGIRPISKSDKLILEGAGRCINCGLCAQGISHMSMVAILQFHLPSSLAISISRSFLSRKDLPKFEGIELGEEHCPTHVPLNSIYNFLTKSK